MIFPMMIAQPTSPGPVRKRRRLGRWASSCMIAAAVTIGSTASTAHAQDDEEALPDARLTGYEAKVDVGGGVAGSYALLAVLGAITIGVAFKNARRTHLD